eukprot:2404457-Pleurochrysis_carterae.AAC.1
MRGAFVIAGGTAEHVVNAVETLKKFNDVKAAAGGADEWSGPKPSALAMHRLSGSLVMSDTCNAARATKRRLTAIVEAATQAEIGEAAWSAMSKAKQAAAVRVHKATAHSMCATLSWPPCRPQ